MKKLIPIVFLLFCFNSGNASHVWGADLTYTCQGNGNYLITYVFYRDCFGITAPTSCVLEVNNTCGFPDATYTLLPISYTEITTCAPTTCHGGNNPGIEKWIYQAVITLNDTCNSWLFSVSMSARNAAVQSLFDPAMYNLYVEVSLNNTFDCDNSPVFQNDPYLFACANQPVCVDPGIYDVDGDSIVASFVVPRTGPNSNVIYQQGYSLAYPMSLSSPLTLNPSTGEFCFTALAPVVSLYSIEVSNYRNGILIGKSVRDVQIYVVTCSGQPDISGINGNAIVDTVACVNQQLCFNINTDGVIPGDSTFLDWDSNIPNANFTVNPGLNESASFCWTPGPGDLLSPQPVCFKARVKDGACIANRTNEKTFCITVYDSVQCLTLNQENIYSNENNFSVSHQPSIDMIKITRNSNVALSVYITNSIGKTIIENRAITGSEFYIPVNLEAGVYFAYLVDKNNKIVATRKFAVMQ